MSVVLFNGEIVDADSARLSVFDGGWLHGAGLFETMRAENGRVFRLEAHLDRIRRSAAVLLRPIERVELPSAMDLTELLDRNQLENARVRLTVSAGNMLAAVEGTASALTVCATAQPLSPPPGHNYERGIQVSLCSFRQSPNDPIAGHKTLSYLPRIIGLREAHRANCTEALWFTTKNHLAEGCISNIFVVKTGMLRTPALDTPVLPGIARAIVLTLAAAAGIETRETTLSVDDLLDAEEVFLTNTMMQVLPVVRVERRDIGDGRVGPMAQKLKSDYEQLVRKECGGE